jgi:hypothetical protein
MVADKNKAYIDLSFEYFLDYMSRDNHAEEKLNSNKLTSDEIINRIKASTAVFDDNRGDIESGERSINWYSFNRILINLIRRSSLAEGDRWSKEKFKRCRRRNKISVYLINHSGKKATDISTHFKMELIDFLIYSNTCEQGYVLGNKKFVSEYKVFGFVAKMFWALGLETSTWINSLKDLDDNDKLSTITDKLRANFGNYERGSIAGFPTSTRLSSMRKVQP